MGISPDNHITGGYQALFRQQYMFNAHTTYLKIMSNFFRFHKITHHFSLLSGFDIFIRCEMIGHQINTVTVKNRFADFSKLFKRRWKGNIVHQYSIYLTLNNIACFHSSHTGVACHVLLCHRHPHNEVLLNSLKFFLSYAEFTLYQL